MRMHLVGLKREPSTTEGTVPLKKGFPFVISLVANPGPLGQSSSYSGVFLIGHSSHSSVPQAAPTEQQQASMRWRPAMGRVHSSSSYLKKQVSRRISARRNRGRLKRATLVSQRQIAATATGQVQYTQWFAIRVLIGVTFFLKRNPGLVMGSPA